jgi:hypothetical protein
MRHPGKFALTLLSASVCLMLTGCFSYSKEETSRAMPSAEMPSTKTSSTTTTTTNDNGMVERQQRTTYTIP